MEEEGRSVGGGAKQFGVGFVDEALLGFPLFAQKQIKGEESVKAMESQEPVERAARGTGRAAGFVAGLPNLVVKGAMKGASLAARAAMGSKKVSQINRFAKSATKAGIAFGALETVSAPEEDYSEKLITIPSNALFGAAAGVAGESVAPAFRKFLISKGLMQNNKISHTPELKLLDEIIDASTVKTPEPVTMKVKKLGGKIVTDWFDRHALIRGTEEQVESNIGRKLPFKASLKYQLDRFMGTQGILERQLQLYGRGIKQAGANVHQLERIKGAQRLKERALQGFENPRGYTSDMADKALLEVKNSLGASEFANLEGIAEQHRRLMRRTLARSMRSGFLSPDDYNNMIKKNKFYSPFEVLEYMAENEGNIALGHGFRSAKAGSLKGAEGTLKDILNPIDSEVRYLTRLTAATEKNFVKRKFVGLLDYDPSLKNTIIPLAKGQQLNKGFKKISLFKDGIKEEYAVPEDIGKVIEGLNEQSIDVMTRLAGKMTGVLRFGATSGSVAFAIPNVFRDFQTAKLASEYGFSVQDWVRGFASALRKDRYYEMWRSGGGAFSGQMEILRSGKAASKLSSNVGDNVSHNLNPINWLTKISELSEQTTRIGVFRRGIRLGYPVPVAVNNARNASIDFAKHGNIMQLANLWIPFLNARVQGTKVIFESLKKNPKKFATTATGIITFPQMATQYWNLTQFPDVWDQISDFGKEENFMFIFGRDKDERGRFSQIAKIPKGDSGKLIGNPIQDFIEFTRGNDPDFGTTALKMLNSILPVDFERNNQFDLAYGVAGSLPPPAKAAVESMTNVNLFTGRPIVPRQLQDAPAEEQYNIETSPMAVKIGDLLNISPMIVENTIGTMTGTLGRQVLNPFESGTLITRRFSGASGLAEQSHQFEILDNIIADKETQDAIDSRLARQAAEDFKGLPDLNARKEFIKERFKDNNKALKQFINIIQGEENGEQPIHRVLKSRSVDERLRFIKEYSLELDTDDEKRDFFQLMLDNKILPEDFLERLK